MNTFKATMIAEGEFSLAGVNNPTKEIVVEAWQYLIDKGIVWELQGYFGRQATALIEEGICHPAKERQEEVCPECGGDGFFEFDESSVHEGEVLESYSTEECKKCNGKGKVE